MNPDERDPKWPPPRDDPDEEPSHPGARVDELDERLATADDLPAKAPDG